MVPADVEPGKYLLCVNDQWTSNGCALITVLPQPSPLVGGGGPLARPSSAIATS
jgi:hypothetical protein